MFDWTLFLELAEELAGRPSSDNKAEACWRSSTSRAYYAAFHVVKDYVCDYDANFNPPNEKVHSALLEYATTKLPKCREHKQIGETLKRLRVDRNLADYTRNPIKVISQAASQLHVRDARRVLSCVESMRASRGSPSP